MPGQKLIPGLVLDTTKDGFDAFYKRPWHAPVLDEILQRKAFSSREIHDFCGDNDIKTSTGARSTVSRAGVIKFLNHLVDEGVLGYEEESTKGGYRRRYHPLMTGDELFNNILHTMLTKINQLFPDKFDYPQPF